MLWRNGDGFMKGVEEAALESVQRGKRRLPKEVTFTLNLKGGAEICQEGGRDDENVCMYKEHDMCDQSVPRASEIINMHMYHLFLPNLSYCRGSQPWPRTGITQRTFHFNTLTGPNPKLIESEFGSVLGGGAWASGLFKKLPRVCMQLGLEKSLVPVTPVPLPFRDL